MDSIVPHWANSLHYQKHADNLYILPQKLSLTVMSNLYLSDKMQAAYKILAVSFYHDLFCIIDIEACFHRFFIYAMALQVKVQFTMVIFRNNTINT